MNDQFLRDYYKVPDQKALQLMEEKLRLTQNHTHSQRWQLPLKPVMVVGVFIILMGVLLSVSPGVRAQVSEWIQQIGGVFVLETNEYPGRGPVETIPFEQYSFDEIANELPFEISLPGWIPEEFEIIPTVKVARFNQTAVTAYIDWKSLSGPILSLMIQHRLDGKNGGLIVGEGSVEEYLVNGEPAALVRGGWNADIQEWDFNLKVLTLSWKHDDQTYVLQGIEDNISVEELLKIAESIQ
ncbi:MAG: DUF4367 domain-containing protein [Anaerolineaceae bacterium]|jgi:hypothetical protein|nr:DUF4367 domain-containing protein [Anaerolineaceae bacterium]